MQEDRLFHSARLQVTELLRIKECRLLKYFGEDSEEIRVARCTLGLGGWQVRKYPKNNIIFVQTILLNHMKWTHISVFKASIILLRQIQNKVFRNSTAFKNMIENLEKYFYLKVFLSSPNLHCFFSKVKTDRDKENFDIEFFDILLFFNYIFKKIFLFLGPKNFFFVPHRPTFSSAL